MPHQLNKYVMKAIRQAITNVYSPLSSVFTMLRGSSQNFGIFSIIGPILLKFSHNM